MRLARRRSSRGPRGGLSSFFRCRACNACVCPLRTPHPGAPGALWFRTRCSVALCCVRAHRRPVPGIWPGRPRDRLGACGVLTADPHQAARVPAYPVQYPRLYDPYPSAPSTCSPASRARARRKLPDVVFTVRASICSIHLGRGAHAAVLAILGTCTTVRCCTRDLRDAGAHAGLAPERRASWRSRPVRVVQTPPNSRILAPVLVVPTLCGHAVC